MYTRNMSDDIAEAAGSTQPVQTVTSGPKPTSKPITRESQLEQAIKHSDTKVIESYKKGKQKLQELQEQRDKRKEDTTVSVDKIREEAYKESRLKKDRERLSKLRAKSSSQEEPPKGESDTSPASTLQKNLARQEPPVDRLDTRPNPMVADIKKPIPFDKIDPNTVPTESAPPHVELAAEEPPTTAENTPPGRTAPVHDIPSPPPLPRSGIPDIGQYPRVRQRQGGLLTKLPVVSRLFRRKGH
jgi:hypothetical protein